MKGFNKMRFISAAISTDKSRYFMCDAYWNAEKGRLEATDGRRAHVWALREGLRDAYKLPEKSCYVKLLPKENMIVPLQHDYQFPNIDRVTPEKSATFRVNLAEDKGNRAYACFSIAANRIVNSDYIGDLMGEVWEASIQNDPTKALRFDCDDLVAVIMPMQADVMDDVILHEEEAKE